MPITFPLSVIRFKCWADHVIIAFNITIIINVIITIIITTTIEKQTPRGSWGGGGRRCFTQSTTPRQQPSHFQQLLVRRIDQHVSFKSFPLILLLLTAFTPFNNLATASPAWARGYSFNSQLLKVYSHPSE